MTVKPTPTAWNWCPHCEQLVDAYEVFDGSEVRCLGCRRWFTCVYYTVESWGLVEIKTTTRRSR